jgi:putative spermidine/putrescine transport system permease protein
MFSRRLGWVVTVPALTFVTLLMILPLFLIGNYSIRNENVARVWPRTAALLKNWDGQSTIDGRLLKTFSRELVSSFRDRSLFPLSIRLNYEVPGLRGTLNASARNLSRRDLDALDDAAIASELGWANREVWLVIQRNIADYTDFYHLTAFDLARAQNGSIHRVEDMRRIYLVTFGRTFVISATVALICLVLAYPVALTLVFAPAWLRGFLFFLVLIPFWTSTLVRTVAWVALLQRNGIVNDILLSLGWTEERMQLIFNRPGLLIAMVHVLLPFMILPLYGIISRVDTTPLKAAVSLGAKPIRAFFDVFVPQTLPGVMSGVLLVFILSIGFYITPELIGGGRDQMITQLIAKYTNELLNWGQAAALSVILLVTVLAFSVVYSRLYRRA